ncbi:unnamed protein product [Protopolystoma xenopodis]|uniref:Uncharacterized protein n=1 Tax=Protopolystoma xenopodis TaxID=117903 RepID=A0A3S5BUY5_9PLAT|nr:unnamed protein product [Protopolystoma xenopodis]
MIRLRVPRIDNRKTKSAERRNRQDLSVYQPRPGYSSSGIEITKEEETFLPVGYDSGPDSNDITRQENDRGDNILNIMCRPATANTSSTIQVERQKRAGLLFESPLMGHPKPGENTSHAGSEDESPSQIMTTLPFAGIDTGKFGPILSRQNSYLLNKGGNTNGVGLRVSHMDGWKPSRGPHKGRASLGAPLLVRNLI